MENKTKDLRSWEEFEAEVASLMAEHSERKKKGSYVSDFLFRGQPDSNWLLTTTLDRYLKQLHGMERPISMNDYYRIVFATAAQVQAFTDVRWEIPSLLEYRQQLDPLQPGFREGAFPAYEYFIYLRHHGFPSPLLDWSKSPYVAAYFAFRDVLSTADRVSIYAFREWVVGHKVGSAGSTEIHGLDSNVRGHKRHFLQQSEYTICRKIAAGGNFYAPHQEFFEQEHKEEQDQLWKFNIPSAERKKVLSKLEQYNVNALSLFGSEESLLESVALREMYLRYS